MAATDATPGPAGQTRVAYVGSSAEFLAALVATPAILLAGQATALGLLLPTLARGEADWLVVHAEGGDAGAGGVPAAEQAARMATQALSPATRVAVITSADADPQETRADPPGTAAAAGVRGPWREVLRQLAAASGGHGATVAASGGGGAAPAARPAVDWRNDLRLHLRTLNARGEPPEAAWAAAASPAPRPGVTTPRPPVEACDGPLGASPLVVMGPKGGTGKTFIAVNLAALLADRAPGRVALLDLDPAGDAAVHLDLTAGPTLADLIPSLADLTDDQLRARMVRHKPSGLDVLRAPPRPELMEIVRPQGVVRLLEVAGRVYRMVVVDTPARPGDEVVAACATCAARAGRLVIVVDADAAGLRRARAALNALPAGGDRAGRTCLVVNRWSEASPLVLGQIEELLGLPVGAIIREDRRPVEEEAFCGRPLVLTHRHHPVSGDLGALLDAVFTGRLPADLGRPGPSLLGVGRSMRRFLAWIRG